MEKVKTEKDLKVLSVHILKTHQNRVGSENSSKDKAVAKIVMVVCLSNDN